MRAAAAVFAFAAFAAASPQGVTSAIAPSSTPEAGCSPNYDGSFAISLVDVNTKRHLEKRQEDAEGALGITLQDGVLTDQSGWTGYVADNSQLQFDNPPQAGALYTAGFSVCSNGHLAIGDDDTWYKCLSGTFFNIYLDNILDAGQCTEVYIQVTRLDGSGSASSASVTTTRTSTTSSMSMAGNSTMIMSSSGAASNGTTATTRRTGAGTATTRTGAGASTATSETPTRGSSQQTGGSGAGSQGGSSSSVGAAGLPTARADVFGMAVGLLAMAAL